MGQLPKKRKLSAIYTLQTRNENGLELKNNKKDAQYLDADIFKKNNVLYDSGWIAVTNDSGIAPLPEDINAYCSLSFTSQRTVQAGQKCPLELYYNFVQDLDIEEKWLPYIKADIMIKTPPLLETVGIFQYQPYEYGNNYYEITTDEQVYKGENPYITEFPQTYIDLGIILESHTSKWYEGETTYTSLGSTYRLEGTLINASAYYDTAYVPDAGGYDYKRFSTSTFDTVSGYSINGQGTEQIGTWVYDPGDDTWDLVLSTPLKEANRSFNLNTVGNTCSITVKGKKYKNGVLQGTGTYSFTTQGNVESGSAILTSFDFHPNENGQLYKLHYSSRRLKQYIFSNSPRQYSLTNLPVSGDINIGDSMPFSTASVKINNGDYPLVEQDDESYHRGYKYEAFGRIAALDKAQNKFKYYANGVIQLTAPASNNSGTTVTFVDETYSFDGNFFNFDGENREPKEVNIYEPSQQVVEFKMLLSIVNPLYYKNKKEYR